MLKNLSQNQILLIALATLLLILAAASFYLLQNPYAPLPFAPQPSETVTLIVPSPSYTPEPSSTSIPTRQTSYTPFTKATTATSIVATETPLTPSTASPGPSGTPSTLSPGITSTPQPTGSQVGTPTPATTTLSPTPSQTLTSGEYEVTGRILQNGTPVPNAVVWFEDDVAGRQTTTDSGGHYSFTTLAPGTHFTLTFDQADNHQIVPAPLVASLASFEGTLPTGIDTIQFPDLEISLNIENMMFQSITPVDGATYSAAFISSANPIQFVWSLYGHGGSYHLELGPNTNETPSWTSSQLASTSYMWDGTLNNDAHISEGAYWWRVAVTTSLGAYVLHLYAQPLDILFNP